MSNIKKKVAVTFMILAMVFTMIPSLEYMSVYADTTELKNPIIEQKESIWDCVYFGSYPQTEVVSDKSQCGTTGKEYEKKDDCIIDATLYAELQSNQSWNDDVCTIDGDKYKRILSSDATNIGVNPESEYYGWNADASYHYFKFEPIKWRVLNVDGNDAFLYADKILDNKKVADYTGSFAIAWETCKLRNWLNNEFINLAFTDAEESAIYSTNTAETSGESIEDKAFILSKAEATASKYGFASGKKYSERNSAYTSTYAKAMGTRIDSIAIFNKKNVDGCGCYWLRTSNGEDWPYVWDNGGTDIASPLWIANHGTRPAIHLNLASSDAWTYANTVSSTRRPTAKISATRNLAATQTVTITGRDNTGIERYYFGTDSNGEPTCVDGIDENGMLNKTIEISADGTYYLYTIDADDNIGEDFAGFVTVTLSVIHGSVGIDKILAEVPSTIKLPAISAETGYEIPEWKVIGEGSDWLRGATDQASYEVPAFNVTLQADCIEKTAKITYMNNTVLPFSVNIPEPVEMKYTEATYITTAEPTLAGYKLKGWSLSSDGKEVDYLPGNLYREARTLDTLGDISLYAVWEQKIPSGGGTSSPDPNDADTAISSTIKDGKEVAKITEEQTAELINNAKGNDVVVNLSSSKQTDVNQIELEIPKNLVEQIAEKKMSLTIETGAGTVSFDKEALSKIGAKDVTLAMNTVTEGNKINLDITLASEKEKVTQFGTGNVHVSLPVSEDVDKDSKVLYLNGKYVDDMNAEIKDGKVEFDTNHFSKYSLMSKKEANKLLVKSIKNSTLGKIKASSSKKAIKLSWSKAKGTTPTTIDIYRSTKAKKGFVKIKTLKNGSKSFTDKKKLKKGKKYYYKVCGKVAVDGKNYKLQDSKVVGVKCK